MYDNIIIKADAQSLGKENLITEFKDLPFKFTIESKDDVITKLKCYHKNLLITIKEKELVITGSICKYLHETNQYTLNIESTKEAFNKLSEDLQLPIHKFSVMLFETSANLIVDNEVDFYFQFLGNLQNFKFCPPVNGTYYYHNSQRKVKIYDKGKELNSNGVKRIPDLVGKNIFRFEYQYSKRVAQHFKRERISVEDLYDVSFYMEVVEKWRDQYFKIYKYSLPTFETTVFRDVKNLKNQLMILGLLSIGGESTIMDMIQQEKRKGTFKFYEQKKRIVNVIKGLCNSESLFNPSNGILELDEKINDEAERQLTICRQHSLHKVI
jgi:hypothetical protein